eukprot:GHVQ01014764.1.p1 GENE.GHVQ01014764.1~~GHVQ01014764.1.p1  ORF type:complete len:1556 (+),score=150.82 GHVQ01014764.1:209-4876(+)
MPAGLHSNILQRIPCNHSPGLAVGLLTKAAAVTSFVAPSMSSGRFYTCAKSSNCPERYVPPSLRRASPEHSDSPAQWHGPQTSATSTVSAYDRMNSGYRRSNRADQCAGPIGSHGTLRDFKGDSKISAGQDSDSKVSPYLRVLRKDRSVSRSRHGSSGAHRNHPHDDSDEDFVTRKSRLADEQRLLCTTDKFNSSKPANCSGPSASLASGPPWSTSRPQFSHQAPPTQSYSAVPPVVAPVGGIKITYKGKNGGNLLPGTLVSPPSTSSSRAFGSSSTSYNAPPRPAAASGNLFCKELEENLQGLGNPEFHVRMYDEDVILVNYGMRQQAINAVVDETFSVDRSDHVCRITWKSLGNVIEGTGRGRNKKESRRSAVQSILIQTGRPGPQEYNNLTRWMYNNLRYLMQPIVSEDPSFRGGQYCHDVRWKVNAKGSAEPIFFESKGQGTSREQAHQDAIQSMYVQIAKRKDELSSGPREPPASQVSTKASGQPSALSQNTAHGHDSHGGDQTVSRLCRLDAGDINKQHNLLAARSKVQATENTVNAGKWFRCTLEWKWKDVGLSFQSMSTVGLGDSKVTARADAAAKMMARAGLVELIDPRDREESRRIKDLSSSNLEAAVRMGCNLISRSTSGVWSLFLEPLWKSVLAKNDHTYVDNIIAALHAATSDARASRPMSPDLWEMLLDCCTVLTTSEFGQSVLHRLGEMLLETRWFPSALAMEYFINFRLMLALEWQASLASTIYAKKEYCHLTESKCFVMHLKGASAIPMMSLECAMQTEERELLNQLSLRENDHVLLRPHDQKFSTTESWDRCFVGVVTSMKQDQTLSINLRLASGEGYQKPETMTAACFKLYYLSSAVTHDRMVEALRALTQHRTPASQTAPSYSFTPGMRYLLLHAMEPQAPTVAGNGPVPHLSDVEPVQAHVFFTQPSDLDSSFKANMSAGPAVSTAAREVRDKIAELERRNPSNPTAPDFSSVPNASAPISGPRILHAPQSSMLATLDMSRVRLPTDLPLTPAQTTAVVAALTRRLTLVQGPPGTGKTHVACAIIDSWQLEDRTKKILAVADSNVAADNLIEGLKRRRIKAVRVGTGSDIDFQDDAISELGKFPEYKSMKERGMHREARVLRMNLFREAVRRYHIVIATCIGSGHEMFEDEYFPRVIIDECAQSIEPSNLIPLGKSSERVVLIGDHKQLPPTIISPEAAERGLDVSLLERFVGCNIGPVHLLDTQRRMHPSISEFPNMQFYQGKLKNEDVNDMNRPPVKGFRWPSRHCRVCLVDVSPAVQGSHDGFERTQGTSKYNLMEIPAVLAIIRSILESDGVPPKQIGVLTPYDAQKIRLRRAVQDSFPYEIASQIEIDSVDGFQGKEKEMVLFSAVRSNSRGEIGFLRDPRRMNVMLTRAKRGLVVVGDQNTLWGDADNWRPWVDWIRQQRSVLRHTHLNEYLDYASYSGTESDVATFTPNASTFGSSSSSSSGARGLPISNPGTQAGSGGSVDMTSSQAFRQQQARKMTTEVSQKHRRKLDEELAQKEEAFARRVRGRPEGSEKIENMIVADDWENDA